MRIVYFGNNRLGWQVLDWLTKSEDEVAALVVHPGERRRFGEEILGAAGLPPERVFSGDSLDGGTCAALAALKPDIGVSVLFGYILRPEVLRLFPKGIINLHPALLPYNRGAHPNVWSIIDGTPAGTTLHYIDEGVDTGDIIGQREVPVGSADTGETLYRRLERESVSLFTELWPLLREGKAPRKPQRHVKAPGTRHRVRDVDGVDEIRLDAQYTGRRLIDILRARTFPPYKGAYFVQGGRKIHLRLTLEPEDG